MSNPVYTDLPFYRINPGTSEACDKNILISMETTLLFFLLTALVWLRGEKQKPLWRLINKNLQSNRLFVCRQWNGHGLVSIMRCPQIWTQWQINNRTILPRKSRSGVISPQNTSVWSPIIYWGDRAALNYGARTVYKPPSARNGHLMEARSKTLESTSLLIFT